MRQGTYQRYIADFETTIYEGQTHTEVWASAIVNMSAPDDKQYVLIDNSIEGFLETVKAIKGSCIVYFHNLKFDGTFILDHFKRNADKYKEFGYTDKEGNYKLKDTHEFNDHAREGNYIYMVSSKGQWYSITLKTGGKKVVFADSLKLLPFSVEKIGKSFNTKHKKGKIEYKGKRQAGGEITNEEREYIANDVLVVKEALQTLIDDGHTKQTIGACCLSEYKHGIDLGKDYNYVFPRLGQLDCPIDDLIFSADEYIRKSYKGGWCYVNEKIKGEVLNKKGCTADVNSLYPSVMHSESGNVYPYGYPHWFIGAIPKVCLEKTELGIRKKYYFIRIRCDFKLKEGYLPTIQIKGTFNYRGTEWLKDSKGFTPTLTLTCTDYELLHKHYDVYNEEIIDGCYFNCAKGFFDGYINRWAKVKQESTGAKREEAKLFLNNLYGKLATSPESSYKVFYLDEETDTLKSHIVREYEKNTEYIAIGSAITAYARLFTITAAQENYKNFCYADTDSIHCTVESDKVKGIRIDDKKFLYWKIESIWSESVFARQKAYIEKTESKYIIRCAGMGKNAKAKILEGLGNGSITLANFKTGLEVSGNLKAKIIAGGTVLEDRNFKMR